MALNNIEAKQIKPGIIYLSDKGKYCVKNTNAKSGLIQEGQLDNEFYKELGTTKIDINDPSFREKLLAYIIKQGRIPRHARLYTSTLEHTEKILLEKLKEYRDILYKEKHICFNLKESAAARFFAESYKEKKHAKKLIKYSESKQEEEETNKKINQKK